MKEKVNVIKVGGAVVEDEQQLATLLRGFAAIEGRKVLVHGGGRLATRLATRLGIETRMVNGRRITDEEMLQVVTMVYGGLVNKQVVARLQSLGVNAVGLTGADMNLIRSHRRPLTGGIDYGYVGDVDCADTEALHALLAAGVTPVIAPLTHDGHGQLLNTNADTMARAVATALVSRYDVSLVYCFEKAGVLARPDDDRSVIPVITAADFSRYKADGTLSGGMIPKIENALAAVAEGVSEVLITKASLLGSSGGTVIR